MHIQACRFDRNNDDGIHVEAIKGMQRPTTLQEEVKDFLRRYPMPLVITDCELYYNQRNGICISDYWKGPVEVSDCVIVGNLEYGLSMQGRV